MPVADVARLDQGSELGASGWMKNYSVSTRHMGTGRDFALVRVRAAQQWIMAPLSSCLLSPNAHLNCP